MPGQTLWAAGADQAHSLLASIPFCLLLLCIALLPLFRQTHYWWERNRNKLLISIVLGLVTLAYYVLRQTGLDHHGEISRAGWPTALAVLKFALLDDYVPFIVMLFSLYTISGGICWTLRMRPTPVVNTGLLLVGTLLASFIGTTGASMLLIRPMLNVNKQRKHKLHTLLFFIFLVANIGGSLLPLGDPPLFIGYLRGVPFLWTLSLLPYWLWCSAFLLGIYFLWDLVAYRYEHLSPMDPDVAPSGKPLRKFEVSGRINYLWLLCVILSLVLLVPNKTLPGTEWVVPKYLREGIMLLATALSWVTTPRGVRTRNDFNFTAIGEVAFLFIGVFLCMMPPLEILQVRGSELGLTKPWQFFWTTGILSSFLDNAPTYAIFFQTALSLTPGLTLPADPLLIAISVGAVFMGANTYIGNGPNFMVKSIAEGAGIAMPSFFGYMLYSGLILIPLFIALTFVFF